MIKLDEVPSAGDHPTIGSTGLDPRYVALTLRSEALLRRLFRTLTPDEMVGLIGGHFFWSGRTKFRGIRVEYDVKSTRVTIQSHHQNPDHARFAAERLYGAFINYMLSEGPSRYVEHLEKRKNELIQQTLLADSALLDALQTQNSQLTKDAENAARASHHLLREQENLIFRVIQSRQADRIRATYRLPFHVVDAPGRERSVLESNRD